MGEPAILPFDWADPFDLEHQLRLEAIRGRLKCGRCGMKEAQLVVLPPV